jgi:hypothetical protein
LFLITTTSPLGKEFSVSVIATAGKRRKVQAKTRGMWIARRTDRGVACINIYASQDYRVPQDPCIDSMMEVAINFTAL